MRAEFRIWHQDDELNYVMFARGNSGKPYPIHDFPSGSSCIQRLMPLVRNYLISRPALRHKLFQVEFLSNLAGECVVTLLYHRQLSAEWLTEATSMEQALGVNIIGRARKQKLTVSQDYIHETYRVGNRLLHYRQYENSFSQPNSSINEKMLNWVCSQTQKAQDDLLELYCGNGNFSIALAPDFGQVLATEQDKLGIRAANYNMHRNDINNMQVARMSAAEVATALARIRPFRRLAHLELDNYQFSTVLVDPPRAGLDTETLQFISRFDNIIYVSCNPQTLRDNLMNLSEHRIHAAALFDQFPFTEHIETGVLLVKPSGKTAVITARQARP